MNAKVENRITNMKNQTFGVEVEMNNISRMKAAEIVASYYGTTVKERSFRSRSSAIYYTYECKDKKDRIWKFVPDGSILNCPQEEECEMVTPILKYDDMEDLQEIIRLLRKGGARSYPSDRCGVHIHVGVGNHTPKTLRNLANIMASHEPLLIDALKLNRTRIDRYCHMVNPTFIKLLNARKPKTMDKFADVWYDTLAAFDDRNTKYNDSRYHMLNYHATFTKGTIEFRLFQFDEPEGNDKNGLHAGQLKSYIQLCLALSQLAKDVSNASPKPQQKENPKYAMRTWLLRLGFIGDEFVTARKFLTKRLNGDASFRNGRASNRGGN